MRYLLIILLGVILTGTSIEDARKANEAYEEGNYEKAITLYKKAIDADSDNAKLYYNLASAQAKAGKSQEAIRTFEQFKNMSDDPERTAMANYDIGNIFAQEQKWDRAVDYYRKSLHHISDDPDAKHNYELAIKKSQNQKKKDKNKKSGQDDKQDNQNQQDKNNKQKNKDNNQQKKGDQNQQNKNQQDNQRQKQQRQQNEVSKAQAQKILRALEQKEKQLLKKFKKKKVKSGDNKNEKDW